MLRTRPEIERLLRESPPPVVLLCGKNKKSLPKTISEADVAALIDTASEHELKDQMVIEIQLKSIEGKGDVERISPIHDNALVLIKLFMKQTKSLPVDTSPWQAG